MAYFHFDDDRDGAYVDDIAMSFSYQKPTEIMKLSHFFEVHIFSDEVPPHTLRIRDKNIKSQWIHMNIARDPSFKERIELYEKKHQKIILNASHFAHLPYGYSAFRRGQVW